MQVERIGAAREEWTRKLTAQQEQVAMQRALQQEQMFRQQQAQEFAVMRQSQTAKAQIAAQGQQFEQRLAVQQQQMIADIKARQQAFGLQQAQEERLVEATQASIRAQETRQQFDMSKLEQIKGTTAKSLDTWKATKEYLAPEAYAAGLVAIQQGRTPKIPTGVSAIKQEIELLRKEEKERKLRGGLTDRERTVAQEAFVETMGKPAGAFGGFTGGLSKDDLKTKYFNFQVRTGYSNRNAVEQTELNNMFDMGIEEYEDAGWFKYYSKWDPKDEDIQKLRSLATPQATKKSKGKLGKTIGMQYLQQAATANPGTSEDELKIIAAGMALRDGYEL